MKKLILSILSLATLSCLADPNSQQNRTESPAEFFRLIKVNVIQSALAPVAATFDRWDELYRSYKQTVEEFVASHTLTQDEVKMADTLLQEMRQEWLVRVKAKNDSIAKKAEEIVKQAEKEAAAVYTKKMLDKIAKKLETKRVTTENYSKQTGIQEWATYTRPLSNLALKASINDYVAGMKKIETYLIELMKKEQLPVQENTRALELLKKAIVQAREAEGLVTIDALPF